MWRLHSAVTLACWSAFGLLASPAAAEQTQLPAVLVINQSNSYRPWPNTIISQFRHILESHPGGQVPLYIEDLDLYRFHGADYLDNTEQYLSRKYKDRAIGVIVPVGSAALDYTLKLRAALWPGTPVVFSAVDRKTSNIDLGSHVTGTTIQLKLADMIRAARSLLPETKRFALVGNQFTDQLYYTLFAQELIEYSRDYEFLNLMGLPLNEVEQRLASLPDHTVILYIGITFDPAIPYTSTELVPHLVKVANRPMIVSTETYFGTGAVGGFVLSPRSVGEETGQLVLRVLDGDDASSIPVVLSGSLKPVFDWRQLKRWGIPESNLPPGSEVRFRNPSLWDQYWWEIIAAAGLLLVQTVVIVRLILERYLRRMAEEESRLRLHQVIHLDRRATAGALSASVAHELNHPLGAILNYVETADVLLTEKPLNLPLLKEIVADIRRDDLRASDVIKNLRGLLMQKSDNELHVFNINDAVNAALAILAPEAKQRGIAVDTANVDVRFPVRADEVQLEQVLLNLLFNAMDAVSECPPARRRLMIQVIPSGSSEVEVVVSDLGYGMPPEALKKVFDPFYTTKPTGTGLGLSIARTIIEAIGGRIWAENYAGGGAIFRFTLPLARETAEA